MNSIRMRFAGLAVIVACMMTAAPQIPAQSKVFSTPQVEAASFKPADPSAPRPGRMGARIDTTPGLLSTRSATLKELIAGAWSVEDYQVTGGPEWIDFARFEVQFKPAAARDQLLRPLLADRFSLAFHRETKNLAVYALEVAKSRPKFGLFQAAASAPLGVNRLGRNVDMPGLRSRCFVIDRAQRPSGN